MCLIHQLSSMQGFSPPVCRQMGFAEQWQRRVADSCSPAREQFGKAPKTEVRDGKNGTDCSNGGSCKVCTKRHRIQLEKCKQEAGSAFLQPIAVLLGVRHEQTAGSTQVACGQLPAQPRGQILHLCIQSSPQVRLTRVAP